MWPQWIEIPIFISCQKLFRFPVEPWAGREWQASYQADLKLRKNLTRRTQAAIGTLENSFKCSRTVIRISQGNVLFVKTARLHARLAEIYFQVRQVTAT